MLPAGPLRVLSERCPSGGACDADSCEADSSDMRIALLSMEELMSAAFSLAAAGAASLASGLSVALRGACVNASKGVGWGSMGSDCVLLPDRLASTCPSALSGWLAARSIRPSSVAAAEANAGKPARRASAPLSGFCHEFVIAAALQQDERLRSTQRAPLCSSGACSDKLKEKGQLTGGCQPCHLANSSTQAGFGVHVAYLLIPAAFWRSFGCTALSLAGAKASASSESGAASVTPSAGPLPLSSAATAAACSFMRADKPGFSPPAPRPSPP